MRTRQTYQPALLLSPSPHAHALPVKHVGHGQVVLTGVGTKTWHERCALRGNTFVQMPKRLTQVIAAMQLQLAHTVAHATHIQGCTESEWKALILSSWVLPSRVEGDTQAATPSAEYIEESVLPYRLGHSQKRLTLFPHRQCLRSRPR